MREPQDYAEDGYKQGLEEGKNIGYVEAMTKVRKLLDNIDKKGKCRIDNQAQFTRMIKEGLGL